jgi:membrane protease YdiL (CAAX protease family)
MLLVAVWILASVAVSQVLRHFGVAPMGDKLKDLPLGERQALMAGNLIVSLTIVGVGLPLIALRTGTTLRDLGWSVRDIAGDLRLGLVSFVLLAPPVYALQGLLVQFWKPSKHPLVEMFKGAPDAGFFWLLFLSAAIAAPFFEEIVFRVLLQGYLEKWFSFRVGLHELLMGSVHPQLLAVQAVDNQERPGPDAAGDDTGSLAADLAQLQNPYASPRLGNERTVSDAADFSGQGELRGAGAWLPIVLSSTVFALLHYTHGPDWIPLLFLAAGLGYLYQRTHRLLPSLVVHCLLNSYSLWGLWIQVQNTAAKG